MKKPIIILAGPTASGKTDMALSIASKIDSVIINADSKQVYREIPIITAQPTEQERQDIEHYLYGFVSCSENFHMASWLKEVVKLIDKVRGDGRTPMLVGGTGMYIKNLMHGLSPIPDISVDVRTHCRDLLSEIGVEELYIKLLKADPLAEGKVTPNDKQRVVRAYEVITHTGKSLFEWQKLPKTTYYNADDFMLYFLSPERQTVYERCNMRFVNMVANGALEEVAALEGQKLDPNLPAMKAHGVPEIIAYLRGTMSLNDATLKAQQNTRNYIKRQFTWFRTQVKNARALKLGTELDYKSAVDEVVRNYGDCYGQFGK